MGWTNPMPMHVGGGGRKLVEDLYATAQSFTGSLLLGGVETTIENKVIARMMAVGWRAARTRARQADPRKLSSARRPVVMPDGTAESLSPLERWERILGLHPSPTATFTERRLAVFDRRALTGRSDRAELLTLLNRVFDGWTVDINENTTAEMILTSVTWPNALNTAAYPGQLPYSQYSWTSTVLYFSVTATAPASVTAEQKAAKNALALRILEDALPSYAQILVYTP